MTAKKYDKACELIGSRDPQTVAATLVRSGVITEYQSDQLKAGRTKLNLGPYLITDWVGQGGMGQVFKAVHRVMGRVVAVKVLPLGKSTEISRDSFMREIRLQAELDHPCVVRAYDAGVDGSVHYLVCEYVPGSDLRRLVRSNGPMSQSHAAGIVAQVARGLHYAHEIGLVHRDIKPGNILVTPDGSAKLSDIGLAAWSMGLDDDPRAGKIVGTADYLSPEQIQSPRRVGPLSDIYSLGCTTYYAVTGKVPFPGGDTKSKCRRHIEQTPFHPRRYAADLSEDFVDVIADMMEKDAGRRIQSANEVASRMDAWAGESFAVENLITRSSWLPPPPPAEVHPNTGSKDPASVGPPVDAATAEVLAAIGESTSDSEGIATGSIPPPLNLDSPRPRRRGGWFIVSVTMLLWTPIAMAAGAGLVYTIDRWRWW